MKVIFKYLIDHISVVNLHICNWTYHYSIASRSCTGCTYCRVRSHICIYSIYSQFIVFYRCTHIFIFTLSRTYLYSRIHALICIHAFTRLFLFPLSCTYLSSAFMRLFVSKHLSLRFQALICIHSFTCLFIFCIHALICIHAFTHFFIFTLSRTYLSFAFTHLFVFTHSHTYLSLCFHELICLRSGLVCHNAFKRLFIFTLSSAYLYSRIHTLVCHNAFKLSIYFFSLKEIYIMYVPYVQCLTVIISFQTVSTNFFSFYVHYCKYIGRIKYNAVFQNIQ